MTAAAPQFALPLRASLRERIAQARARLADVPADHVVYRSHVETRTVGAVRHLLGAVLLPDARGRCVVDARETRAWIETHLTYAAEVSP